MSVLQNEMKFKLLSIINSPIVQAARQILESHNRSTCQSDSNYANFQADFNKYIILIDEAFVKAFTGFPFPTFGNRFTTSFLFTNSSGTRIYQKNLVFSDFGISGLAASSQLGSDVSFSYYRNGDAISIYSAVQNLISTVIRSKSSSFANSSYLNSSSDTILISSIYDQPGTASVQSYNTTSPTTPIYFTSLTPLTDYGISQNVPGTLVQVNGSGFSQLPGYSTGSIPIYFFNISAVNIITCFGYPYSDSSIVFVIPPFTSSFVPATYFISLISSLTTPSSVIVTANASILNVVDFPTPVPSFTLISLDPLDLNTLPTTTLVEVTSLSQSITVYGTDINLSLPVIINNPLTQISSTNYGFIASGSTNISGVYYYTISVESIASSYSSNGIYTLLPQNSAGNDAKGVGVIINLPIN